MEIKYLYTFKTILEAGSFQRAAEQLNYAQSTVTFQIQQLEQELSVKLFDKIGRKMILSQAGQEILPYIDQIIQSLQQIENYGKNEKELTGTLKIALPETLLTYQMQPILAEFHKQAPNVKLSMQALNCYSIRDKVSNGEVDLGIHYDTGGYTSSISMEKFMDFPVVLVAAAALEDEMCDFKSKNQKKPICLLTNDTDSIFQKKLDAYLEEKKIELDGRIELGSIEAIKRSVISNLGVTFLPRYVVEEELESGQLKILETELTNWSITSAFTYHKNKWFTPAMKLLIKLTKDISGEEKIKRLQ